MASALELLGGVATRSQLVALCTRVAVDRALASGDLAVLAQGRYAGPQADQARRAAHALTGAVCLLSAATRHGWAVKRPPARPQVVVPRGRNVSAGQRAIAEVRWARLDEDDVCDGVTSADRTLLDCGRLLPRDEALAVFDSALRSGVNRSRLRVLARDARGPGSATLRWLAQHATALAANPFESVLRDVALDVPGLRVRPQVPLWGSEFLGCPDLVDEDLGIVIEADSFTWHGGRDALADDARRYNQMAVAGWLVLRFAWEQVMDEPDYVRRILEAAVARRSHGRPGNARPA